MTIPLQITFRNMRPSAAVAAKVRAEAEKLDRYYNRITSGRVIIEAPHRHHKRGDRYLVRIDLGVPGGEIVVKHAPDRHQMLAQSDGGKCSKSLETGGAHKNIYVTIRDAFRTARGLLEDYARRLRLDVKVHSRIPLLRVEKMKAERLAGGLP